MENSHPFYLFYCAVVQSLNDGRAHLVDMPDEQILQWTLLALDMERKELTFYEYDYTKQRSSLTMLSLGSERQGDSIVAQGVDAQFTTLLRVGSGLGCMGCRWGAQPTLSSRRDRGERAGRT